MPFTVSYYPHLLYKTQASSVTHQKMAGLHSTTVKLMPLSMSLDLSDVSMKAVAGGNTPPLPNIIVSVQKYTVPMQCQLRQLLNKIHIERLPCTYHLCGQTSITMIFHSFLCMCIQSTVATTFPHGHPYSPSRHVVSFIKDGEGCLCDNGGCGKVTWVWSTHLSEN